MKTKLFLKLHGYDILITTTQINWYENCHWNWDILVKNLPILMAVVVLLICFLLLKNVRSLEFRTTEELDAAIKA